MQQDALHAVLRLLLSTYREAMFEEGEKRQERLEVVAAIWKRVDQRRLREKFPECVHLFNVFDEIITKP